MKCPECVAEGERSKVYPQGSTTTLMAAYSYFDEDGEWHVDDPNTRTTAYSCSRGHNWTVTTTKGLTP